MPLPDFVIFSILNIFLIGHAAARTLPQRPYYSDKLFLESIVRKLYSQSHSRLKVFYWFIFLLLVSFIPCVCNYTKVSQSVPALPTEQCHSDQLVVRALHVRLPEVHGVPGHGEGEALDHDPGREDFALVRFRYNKILLRLSADLNLLLPKRRPIYLLFRCL